MYLYLKHYTKYSSELEDRRISKLGPHASLMLSCSITGDHASADHVSHWSSKERHDNLGEK